MAGLVGKYAANKFLKKHMKQYENKKVESGQVSAPDRDRGIYTEGDGS